MASAKPSSSVPIIIRVIGFLILIGMVLFPPWQQIYTLNGGRNISSAGYRALWDPPSEEVKIADVEEAGYRVNVVRLGIQLVAVLVVMNVAIYFLRSSKPEEESSSEMEVS